MKTRCDNCNKEMDLTEQERIQIAEGACMVFCSLECQRLFVNVWNAYAHTMES